VINADFKEGVWSKKILLSAGESELDQLAVSFPAYSIDFGDNSSDNNWIEYSDINTLRLSVREGIAKFYINDYLRGKLTLNNPNTVYTKFLINGIRKDDRLFEVGTSGHSLPQSVNRYHSPFLILMFCHPIKTAVFRVKI
jgi:hypothetical protein